MSEFRGRMDEEARRVRVQDGALDIVVRRVDRRRTVRRVGGVVLALAVTGASLVLAYTTFTSNTPSRPGIGPAPGPTTSGSGTGPLTVEIRSASIQVQRSQATRFVWAVVGGRSIDAWEFGHIRSLPAHASTFLRIDPAHLEKAEALRDEHFPGAPIKYHQVRNSTDVEIWVGDDYVQSHRGELHLFDFVESFMQTRTQGEGAERFLGQRAVERYERGEGSLSLYGYLSHPEVVWGVAGWDEEGEGSFIAGVYVWDPASLQLYSERLYVSSSILTDPESPEAEIVLVDTYDR